MHGGWSSAKSWCGIDRVFPVGRNTATTWPGWPAASYQLSYGVIPQQAMTFIMPDVPSGTHPWAPAEDEFESKIRPLVARHLDIAERCVRIGSDLLARAQGR